jgi:hypothetical protein
MSEDQGSLLPYSHPSRVPAGAVKQLAQSLTIVSDRFDRAAGQRFFARGQLGFILGLFADKRVGAFERTGKVFRGRFPTDVAIYTGSVDVKCSRDIIANFIVWIGHESAGYADFRD